MLYHCQLFLIFSPAQLKDELSAILHLALTDTDQWVSTIADILRSYPVSGQLNLDLEENHSFIAETLKHLRKTCKILLIPE